MNFRHFLLIIIAAGICLRFVNLDQKIFWVDEALGSYRAIGSQISDAELQRLQSADYSPQQVRALFQAPRKQSSSRGSIEDILGALRAYEPLYTAFAHQWMSRVGGTPQAMRALPALIGVFVVAAVYFLGKSLNWSPMTTLIGMAMFSVSPVLIAFSQEARPYSLLAFWTIVASILFLKALEHDRRRWWTLYGIAVIAGLYTQVLFAPVLIAHAAYLLLNTWQKRAVPAWSARQRLFNFALFGTLSVLAFTPWLTFWGRRHPTLPREGSYLTEHLAPVLRAQRLALRLTWPFVDSRPLPTPLVLLLVLLLLLLVASSIYILLRRHAAAPTMVLFFILVASFGMLFAWDIVEGGIRSLQARFLMPGLVSLLLLTAFGLGKTTEDSGDRRRLRQAITAAILLVGLITSLWAVMTPAARGKGDDEAQLAVVEILNEQTNALVLIPEFGKGDGFGQVMGLSHKLDSDVHFTVDVSAVEHLSNGRELFLYKPSPELLAQAGSTDCAELEELVQTLLWRAGQTACLLAK